MLTSSSIGLPLHLYMQDSTCSHISLALLIMGAAQAGRATVAAVRVAQHQLLPGWLCQGNLPVEVLHAHCLCLWGGEWGFCSTVL